MAGETRPSGRGEETEAGGGICDRREWMGQGKIRVDGEESKEKRGKRRGQESNQLNPCQKKIKKREA